MVTLRCGTPQEILNAHSCYDALNLLMGVSVLKEQFQKRITAPLESRRKEEAGVRATPLLLRYVNLSVVGSVSDPDSLISCASLRASSGNPRRVLLEQKQELSHSFRIPL